MEPLDDPIPVYTDPSQDPFETADWDIVSFTDPRVMGQAYDIIDGRVLVAFKNPPVLPLVDPNYFDVERPDNDPVYGQVAYNYTVTTTAEGQTMLNDPAIAAFVAAEDLEVYSEWPMVAGLAAVLPEGQTVADAVANWPTEYPNLIDAVDPDALVTPCVDPYPIGDPNDEKFPSQWAINEANQYNINVRRVQRESPNGRGDSTRVIAILDTGVDYSLLDLYGSSTPYGCNTGDKRASTQFMTRSSGGGSPWTWLYTVGKNAAQRQSQMQMLGHGTCMAGACSALINNEIPGVPTPDDDRDIAGVADYPKYFPVAAKYQLGFTTSATLNGLTAIGCVKGVYNKTAYYGASFFVPSYNIEVVNVSIGGVPTAVGNRHLYNLSPYMLIVGAAGNDDSSSKCVWPASYTTSIAVAAYSESGQRWHDGWSVPAQGSNYSLRTDIAAPGAEIYTSDMRGSYAGIPFGLGPNVVASVAGTSIAAPFVSGVAVLISGKPGSPSPATIKQRIISSHQPLPGQLAFCGRLDAWGAMQ